MPSSICRDVGCIEDEVVEVEDELGSEAEVVGEAVRVYEREKASEVDIYLRVARATDEVNDWILVE